MQTLKIPKKYDTYSTLSRRLFSNGNKQHVTGFILPQRIQDADKTQKWQPDF